MWGLGRKFRDREKKSFQKELKKLRKEEKVKLVNAKDEGRRMLTKKKEL